MSNTQYLTTPVILALTRRATLCGLPYNTFITLLIGGCVTFIWIDSLLINAALLMGSYLFCSILCSRDMWALDIFLIHIKEIGICHRAVKQYFNARSYGAE
jgi:type IV secretory pathway VirB3-like protein